MEAPEVLRLVQLLEARGISVWLDGGWGVDARLEEQVREHDDLDLVVEMGRVASLIEVMTAAGYQVVGERRRALSSSMPSGARSMSTRCCSTKTAAAACISWRTGASGCIPRMASPGGGG
jgi:hypothetical protein